MNSTLNNKKADIIMEDTMSDGPAASTPYVVWCTAPQMSTLANNIIRAMYYLPSRFVLLLPRTTLSDDMAARLPIADQIRVYENNSSSQDELLRIANVVVGDKEVVDQVSIPSIAVSAQAKGVSESAHGYDSTSSPEAIATALLRLSHATI